MILFRAVVANIPLTAPHVINALLIAQYMNPSVKVLSTLLSEGDLRKLKRKSQLLAEANTLLGNAARAESADALKIYAYFVRVASHLTQKEALFKDTVFKLLSQIPQPGQVQGGDAVPIVDAPASSRDAPAHSMELVRRDENGQLTDLSLRLQAEGTIEGCWLSMRKGVGGDADQRVVAQVVSIKDKVNLRSPGKAGVEGFWCEEILADWEVAETPPSETQGWVTSWETSLLSQKMTGAVEVTKHLILLSLAQLSHHSASMGADGSDALRIHTKPRLGVFFSTDYLCTRRFCLTPDATQVEASEKKSCWGDALPWRPHQGNRAIVCVAHFLDSLPRLLQEGDALGKGRRRTLHSAILRSQTCQIEEAGKCAVRLHCCGVYVVHEVTWWRRPGHEPERASTCHYFARGCVSGRRAHRAGGVSAGMDMLDIALGMRSSFCGHRDNNCTALTCSFCCSYLAQFLCS